MPLSIKAPRREDFVSILQNLEYRLEGWKAKFLSRAGRLQLIKSVLSSIPTYYMSCFAFPKWLTARIDSIRRQFLWATPQNSNPIHLLNWRTACLPLTNGGLGIPDLHLQNTSLLLRWWWRLYDPRPKLWSNYAKLIYATRADNAAPLILSPKGSFFWRSLIKLKPIFHSSICYQINSGEQTSFWHDAWTGQPLSFDKPGVIARRAISVREAKPIFHQLLPAPLTLQQHHANQMMHSMVFTTSPDRIVWRLSPLGVFFVKSIYKILSQGGKTISRSSSIWAARVLPSMAFFFFLLINSKLLTQDKLLRRRITLPQIGCVLCAQHRLEDAMHLFFLCPYATVI